MKSVSPPLRTSFSLLLGHDLACTDALARFVRDHSLQNYRIIVDSVACKNAILSKGLDASDVGEYVKVDSLEEREAYQLAFSVATSLEKLFSDIEYQGLPVYHAIKSIITESLTFLNKVELIFEKIGDATSDRAVILALSGSAYYYVSVADLAKLHGFDVQDVVTCKKGKIKRPVASKLFRQIRYAWFQTHTLLAQIAASASLQDRVKQIAHGSNVPTLFYLQTNEYDLYMKPVYPVLSEFQRTRHKFLVITYDELVERNLRSRGIEVLSLRKLREPLRRRHYEVLERIKQRLNESGRTDAFGNAFRILRPYLNDYWFYRKVLDVLRAIDDLTMSVEVLKPKAMFVMPDTTPMSAVVSMVARRFEVPTFTTVAASPGETYRNVGEYFCDYIALDGTDAFRDLEKAGYEKSRLILVGSPALDEQMRRSRQDDQAYLRQFTPLDFSRHVFLIAASRFDSDENVWMSRIIRILNQRGDSEVVLKVHPFYGRAIYEDVIKECKGLRYFIIDDPTVSIYPLINVADVVVTDYSHTGKEAIAFGKPLITVNLTDREFPSNRYAEDGVAVHVSDIEQLSTVIDRILKDKELLLDLARSRRDAMNKYNYLNDGRAARRLFELLSKPNRPPH